MAVALWATFGKFGLTFDLPSGNTGGKRKFKK